MTTSPGMKKAQNLLKWLWDNYSIVIVTLIIVVICTLLAPRFLTVRNMMAISRNASVIGMISLGMTFVIIAGGIDLSAGHIVATSGAALILLQGNPEIPIPLAILACIGLAMVIGLFSGTIITKAFLPPFIVTLAIGTFCRSIAMYYTQGTTIVGRNVPEFTTIGMGSIGFVPIPLIIFLTFACIFGFVLNYTKFGSYVYAVGGNENAARYSGINVHMVRITTYVLLGFCIGIAALIDFSRMAAVSTAMSGYLYEFDAITAVVIGGTALSGGRGRILGTVMGVFIIGIITNILIMLGLSPFLSGAVKGVIILTAVLLQKKER